MTRRPPIFVLGCPRSGTTLLRVMLNAHEHLAIPPENRFVVPLYFRRHGMGTPGTPAYARKLARAITSPGKGSSHMGISREALLKAFESDPPASVAEAIDRVFSDFASARGHSRWGDKRPSYYAFVEELDRIHPDAQFVHLVRDGRACVASLKREPFNYTGRHAIVTWLNAMHACRKAGRELPSDRYLELRYEDLVTAPEATLRRLCDFLSEPFDARMTHPEDIVKENVPAHFQQHGQIAAGVNPSSMRSWEHELSTAEILALERLGARHFDRFDYDRSGRAGLVPVFTLRCALGHLRFRCVLTPLRWWDRQCDAGGVKGRAARRLWRRFRPRRLLSS